MLSCKQCFGSTDELVDGLCFTCSPINMVDWFNAKDGDNDSDQPKADLIVMQEKIAGLFQTVAAHSNVTFGAFTAINSLIDDLTKDVKYLAELSQKSLEDRNELSERLAVLEKNHGMP